MAYDNTTLTITTTGTPDPFVIYANSRFLMTFTAGDRIELWSGHSLLDFQATSTKHIIWTPPPGTDHSAQVWAPELHAIRGRWYVYFAAAHPDHGNRSHRMFVLGGPSSDENPCEGRWEFLGPIVGLEGQWMIDGTVFELGNALYFVYSGWPFENHDDSELIQQLFIARLSGPTTAGSQPVLICAPSLPWEFTRDGGGDHGINEGPQWLSSPDGQWRGLVYSCAGSWTPEYKMATLRYVGGDPLAASSWQKSSAPLLETPRGGGLYGPGHGSFIGLGDDIVGVFHATESPTDGWENRKARVKLVRFVGGGPDMGGLDIGHDSPVSLLRRLWRKLGGEQGDEEGVRLHSLLKAM